MHVHGYGNENGGGSAAAEPPQLGNGAAILPPIGQQAQQARGRAGPGTPSTGANARRQYSTTPTRGSHRRHPAHQQPTPQHDPLAAPASTPSAPQPHAQLHQNPDAQLHQHPHQQQQQHPHQHAPQRDLRPLQKVPGNVGGGSGRRSSSVSRQPGRNHYPPGSSNITSASNIGFGLSAGSRRMGGHNSGVGRYDRFGRAAAI